MSDVAVMGAGAWGSALAQVLADAGNSVTLWARRPEIADEINTDHRNRRYLALPCFRRRCGPPRTRPWRWSA